MIGFDLMNWVNVRIGTQKFVFLKTRFVEHTIN